MSLLRCSYCGCWVERFNAVFIPVIDEDDCRVAVCGYHVSPVVDGDLL